MPSSQREYGLIYGPAGESLLEQAVAEGMVKVREEAGKRESAEDASLLIEKLNLLEEIAKKEGKGVWSMSDDGRIEMVDGPVVDPQAFIGEWKGKSIQGKELPLYNFVF